MIEVKSSIYTLLWTYICIGSFKSLSSIFWSVTYVIKPSVWYSPFGSISLPNLSFAFPILKQESVDAIINHTCMHAVRHISGVQVFNETYNRACDCFSNADSANNYVVILKISWMKMYLPSSKAIAQNTIILVQIPVFVKKSFGLECKWVGIDIFIMVHCPASEWYLYLSKWSKEA